MTTFRKELESLINQHSQENGSNTPDFIIANFLNGVLVAFDNAVNAREQWYGREGGRRFASPATTKDDIAPPPKQEISNEELPNPVLPGGFPSPCERLKLTKHWGLRKLAQSEPAWALQYLGMDWLKITEFTTGGGNGTNFDKDIRKFAASVKSAIEKNQPVNTDLDTFGTDP